MKAWLSEIEAGFLVPLHIKTLYGKDVELLRKEQKVVFFSLLYFLLSLCLSLFLFFSKLSNFFMEKMLNTS